ncbi:MAG: hypothetical protein WDN29_07820 [Methylovirgula sp.]
MAKIDAIDEDFAFGRRVESRDQSSEGRLAGTDLADDANFSPGDIVRMIPSSTSRVFNGY